MKYMKYCLKASGTWAPGRWGQGGERKLPLCIWNKTNENSNNSILVLFGQVSKCDQLFTHFAHG